MRFKIPNFVQTHPLDVYAAPGVGNLPTVVTLGYYSGPVSFHHGMTPTQARDMAAALLTLADDADRRDFDLCLADVTDAELADLAANLELAAEVTG